MTVVPHYGQYTALLCGSNPDSAEDKGDFSTDFHDIWTKSAIDLLSFLKSHRLSFLLTDGALHQGSLQLKGPVLQLSECTSTFMRVTEQS